MDLITKRFSTLSTQIAFYNPHSPIYTFYPMLFKHLKFWLIYLLQIYTATS